MHKGADVSKGADFLQQNISAWCWVPKITSFSITIKCLTLSILMLKIAISTILAMGEFVEYTDFCSSHFDFWSETDLILVKRNTHNCHPKLLGTLHGCLFSCTGESPWIGVKTLFEVVRQHSICAEFPLSYIPQHLNTRIYTERSTWWHSMDFVR